MSEPERVKEWMNETEVLFLGTNLSDFEVATTISEKYDIPLKKVEDYIKFLWDRCGEDD